jgi:hypothetical protein
MKKFIFGVCLVLFIFVFLINTEDKCLNISEFDLGTVFGWRESCEVTWDFLAKENPDDMFEVGFLESRRPYLLQFAGPFTDSDGTGQGLIFQDGVIVEDDGDVYSGIVVIENGELKLFSKNDFSDLRNDIVKRELSGFSQALMVENGLISKVVEGTWSLYSENKSYNYRFLVEDQSGEVMMLDFYNKGLKTVLDSVIAGGYTRAVYLDIAGSELGYFWNGMEYEALGGSFVKDRYDPSSPGGFLELRVN